MVTFEKLLNDIEQLKGVSLYQINPTSSLISLVEINPETGKYLIKPESGRVVNRNITELEKVWDELKEFGYANVEAVLQGGGSSRSHPETLFANLPYIRHFQYQRKKHIMYSVEELRPFGTLKEANPNQLKAVRSCLQNKASLKISSLYSSLRESYHLLEKSLDVLLTKYPAEMKDYGVSGVLDSLKKDYELTSAVLYNKPTIEIAELSSHNRKGINTQYNFEEEEGEEEVGDLKFFDRNSFRVRQLSLTFSLIYDRIHYEEIELQPDFQRKDRIWSLKQKSLLIESILLGLPIPQFYFAEMPNGEWLIVDGLQRITTVYDFMNGDFCLKGLKFFNKELNSTVKLDSQAEILEGMKYEDLPRKHQRNLREFQIQGHLISVMNRNDLSMVRELFQRINTYGSSLSNQEIRSALYPGSAIAFSRYLVEDKPFLDALEGRIKSERMRDVEFVLSALSFVLIGYKNYSFESDDDFIISGMKLLNRYKFSLMGRIAYEGEGRNAKVILPAWNLELVDPIFSELKQRFERALVLSKQVFGEARFRKYDSNTINKQLFTLITSVFMVLDENIISALIKNKEKFRLKFDALLLGQEKAPCKWTSTTYEKEGRDFEYSISQSTGKKPTVFYRFENFIWLIKDITGLDFKVEGLISREILEDFVK